MAWYYEGAIAERLGLTRSALEDYRARSLKKNGDWKKIGRSVALSEASLKKLLAYLGASNFDCSACLVGKNGPPLPEVVELVVTRVYPNPRLILAAFLDDARETHPVRVSVANNINLRRGMKIKARPPTGEVQLYRLEGRCPRFPGKW